MHGPLAFTFLEWVGIVSLVAIGLILIGALGISLFDRWGMRGLAGDEYVHPDRAAGDGTLLCDYVDHETLASVARQRGIEMTPSQLEREKTVSRSRRLRFFARGAGADSSRGETATERETYDPRVDPNDLLRQVLAKLETDGHLERGLGYAPMVAMVGDEDRMRRYLDVIREEDGADAADQTLARLITMEKREELEAAFARRPFVLIEGDWLAEPANGGVSLLLGSLRPPVLAYELNDGYDRGLQRGDPTPMPPGVRIYAHLSTDHITTSGRERLAERVHAGALATIASYDAQTGRMVLSPIAVFARHGGRPPGGPRVNC